MVSNSRGAFLEFGLRILFGKHFRALIHKVTDQYFPLGGAILLRSVRTLLFCYFFLGNLQNIGDRTPLRSATGIGFKRTQTLKIRKPYSLLKGRFLGRLDLAEADQGFLTHFLLEHHALRHRPISTKHCHFVQTFILLDIIIIKISF